MYWFSPTQALLRRITKNILVGSSMKRTNEPKKITMSPQQVTNIQYVMVPSPNAGVEDRFARF